MLKYIRVVLVVLFVLALALSGWLFYYNYTHEDIAAPAFVSDADLLEVSVNADRNALCKGLHAYDNMDGDITDRILVQNVSQLINSTDVLVTYLVMDDASNYATYTRTVRYTDYRPPRFVLTKPMFFNAGETITFLDRISATDVRDGDITGRLSLLESTAVNNSPGTYRVVVSVTNRMGDTATLPLTVLVVNQTASMPRLQLSSYLIYLPRGERPDFSEYLEQVVDPLERDQEIPLKNVKINYMQFRPNDPGVYEVYYYYTGQSGETVTAILTVVVE